MEIKVVEDFMYILNENGEKMGHIQFEVKDENVLDLAHTVVYPEHRGKGLAEKLVLAFIDKADKEGKKIIPSCPYAAEWFQKNEGYQHYLK